MNIKGTLLKFGVVNADGTVISKDCKIGIPDIIPVVYEFDFSDPNKILGLGHVTRTDDGLTMSAELYDKEDIKNVVKIGDGIGGYFNKVVDSINDNGERIVESMSLRSCSIVGHPVYNDYRITEVSDEFSEHNRTFKKSF